jgi:ribosomal protein S18 acetylase RimI-like enzyme
MITYTSSTQGISEAMLLGFFVGWPTPPSPATHLRILQRSSHVVIALDYDNVVGFITAISDGVLSAYIPLLEVLPSHQHHGIGSELVKRMLAQLEDLYMVDLCCDDSLKPFYERFDMRAVVGMIRRNYRSLTTER